MNTHTIQTPRPTLAFYHANGKRTGSALTVALKPATPSRDGRLVVGLTPQDDSDCPRFDWARKIEFNLYFTDVCEFLRVFRGEAESIADGRGLFHRTTDANIRINLRHIIEPVSSYAIEVCERRIADMEERCVCFTLSSAEAVGLTLAIEGSMSALCFGIHGVFTEEA
jgi:hypothetical protein